MSVATDWRSFRNRVGQGERVFGTFIKTPTTHAIEILAACGYDFVVIDAEHAPFDRQAIDTCVLAARASGTTSIVRVQSRRAADIGDALDAGATGVMIPHLTSADVAREAVEACRYSGRRGYSNSPRAGDFGGRSMWGHIDLADAQTTIIGMVEDPEGVEAIDRIVQVPGLDAIFIGRGDLGAAYRDRAPGSPRVQEATDRIVTAAARRGLPVFLMPGGAEDAAAYASRGVRGFIIGSDQGFLRSAALSSLAAVRDRTRAS
ncbi:MAG: HpcH/HpaI aldolase/citrate lyase family protein [Lautropia sp.]